MVLDYNKIVNLVYSAREIVYANRKPNHVMEKNEYDFVTEVDMGISEFMKKELKKLHPEIGFMTEEEQTHSFTDKIFILDPIDGTTNLIYDYKMSSISLAYAEDGIVRFGVVFNPFSNEMFFAIKGKGAFRYYAGEGVEELLSIGVENYDKERLQVSRREMKKALIEFGASSSHKDMTDETFARGGRVFRECLDLRRTCSTALAICYISSGRLDGYFEKIIKPWDYAAGILILDEAGGKSSDWEGADLPLDREGTIICSNLVIHDELLSLM